MKNIKLYYTIFIYLVVTTLHISAAQVDTARIGDTVTAERIRTVRDQNPCHRQYLSEKENVILDSMALYNDFYKRFYGQYAIHNECLSKENFYHMIHESIYHLERVCENIFVYKPNPKYLPIPHKTYWLSCLKRQMQDCDFLDAVTLEELQNPDSNVYQLIHYFFRDEKEIILQGLTSEGDDCFSFHCRVIVQCLGLK